MKKIVVVTIDDVLNDFTAMLTEMGMGDYDKNDPVLRNLLYNFKEGRLTPLAEKIMSTVAARKQSIAFIDWLSQNGFTVILCTDRDLRIAYDITVKWLNDNGVKFDYLFTADNLIEFCRDMEAQFLIFGISVNNPDKNQQSINYKGKSRVELDLYCFSNGKADEDCQEENYRVFEFDDFEGVKQCIQKRCC